MMPNITRGGRMEGLMTYLAGGGRTNEHEDQHLVAGDPAIMTMYGDDELDRATALAIARDLDEPHRVFGVDVTQLKTIQDPETGETHKERVDAHVWHCSLSLRAEEGQLSDEQWSRSRTTSLTRWSSPRPGPGVHLRAGSRFGTGCRRTATTTSTSPCPWSRGRHEGQRAPRPPAVAGRRPRPRVKYRLQLTTSRIAASAERGERPRSGTLPSVRERPRQRPVALSAVCPCRRRSVRD